MHIEQIGSVDAEKLIVIICVHLIKRYWLYMISKYVGLAYIRSNVRASRGEKEGCTGFWGYTELVHFFQCFIFESLQLTASEDKASVEMQKSQQKSGNHFILIVYCFSSCENYVNSSKEYAEMLKQIMMV